MMPRGSLSPVGSALFSGEYGGGTLQDQRDQESEELRRKRMQQAQSGGFSPTGVALAASGILGE